MVWCVGLECVVVLTLYYDRVCEDDGWLAFGVLALYKVSDNLYVPKAV